MNWVHMGLACRAEADADRFFVDLLGLTKSEVKTLPAVVADGLFGVAADLAMINYTSKGLQFEVLIDPDRKNSNDPIVHACLEIEDRAVFLERCRMNEVEVIQVPKGERLLVFVRDYDGNLYEIKEIAAS